jgi:hypothetical protein
MQESFQPLTRLFMVALACVMIPLAAPGADDAALTKDQIKVFLQTAEVIKSKQSAIGVTHPWRLTLSNGTITHDASFQDVDERKSEMKLASGKVELAFVDSYKYNIAAYQLAELIGLDDMLPVYVERKWQGKTGSISWWFPVKMDDADRVEKKIEAIPISGTSRCTASAFSTSLSMTPMPTSPTCSSARTGPSGASISAAPSAPARTCARRKIW